VRLLPARVFCDLDGVDELTGEFEVVGPGDARKIRCEEPRGSQPGVSPADIARQVPEAPVRCRFPVMTDDHRCPARPFTALRTSMTESMSSRFRRR
jgi:hypothetical protein